MFFNDCFVRNNLKQLLLYLHLNDISSLNLFVLIRTFHSINLLILNKHKIFLSLFDEY